MKTKVTGSILSSITWGTGMYTPPETLKLHTQYFKHHGQDHIAVVSLVATLTNYYKTEISREPFEEDIDNAGVIFINHPSETKLIVTYPTLAEAKDDLAKQIRLYCR